MKHGIGCGKIRRKYFLLAFCVICLLSLALTGYRFGEAGRKWLSVPAVTAEDLQEMTGEAYEEYTEKPTLYFDGHIPAYDRADDIYYITQDMEAGFFRGGLSSSEGKLYWQSDGYFSKFADALSMGHLFSLYCVNEETKNWCSYRVVFSGMPIMVIETQDGNMIGDDLGKAQMRLFDLKFSGGEYTAADCQARIRGGSSRKFDKKGYKLELDENQTLLGMRNDDDWILTALYDDSGLIHNKFSYDVWRNLAGGNATKKDDGTTMEFVELFCNDVYLGVYGVVERIDEKELSLGRTKDILYKCKGYDLPEEPEEWNYILEQDYVIKYPKEYGFTEWVPLQTYLETFTGEEGIADYEQAVSLLNMDNAVDHNLFIMLSYGCDNFKRKNTFYVAQRQENENPAYTIIQIPWDCNATWGNFWRADRKFNNTIYEPERITDPNLWSEDMKALFLCNPDEVGELLRERWTDLRLDIFSEERLEGMLDEEFSYLHGSGAYDRNYRRWPNGTEYWDDSYIYEYVEGRLKYLDDYFENPYLDEIPPLDY